MLIPIQRDIILTPVSYTHLDVYKRQLFYFVFPKILTELIRDILWALIRMKNQILRTLSFLKSLFKCFFWLGCIVRSWNFVRYDFSGEQIDNNADIIKCLIYHYICWLLYTSGAVIYYCYHIILLPEEKIWNIVPLFFSVCNRRRHSIYNCLLYTSRCV